MTKKGKKGKWKTVPLEELGLGDRAVVEEWKPVPIIPGEVHDPTSYDFPDTRIITEISPHYSIAAKQSIPKSVGFEKEPPLLETLLEKKCVLAETDAEKNISEPRDEGQNFSITACLREFHGGHGLNCDLLPDHMIKSEDNASSVLETTKSEFVTASEGTSSPAVNQSTETFITPDDIEDVGSDDLSDQYHSNDEAEEYCIPRPPDEEVDEEELRRVRLNAFIEAVPSKEGVHVHPLYYKIANQKGFEKYRLERQGTITHTSARSHHLKLSDECFGFKPKK